MFSAAYSGDRTPFSPTSFLTCWWQLSDSLAGYQQHDAHEFYLFMLSGLEASRVAATPTPSAASPAPGAFSIFPSRPTWSSQRYQLKAQVAFCSTVKEYGWGEVDLRQSLQAGIANGISQP